MRNFSDEELISRIWDIEEIKKLIHRRVYYQAEDRREDELSDLWVREPKNRESASFGRNWGYYTGMDNIYNYYVKEHYKKLDEQKNANHASTINQGNIYAHPVSTGLVELAGDGKTAKGMWYSIAQETKAVSEMEAYAGWILEKIAVDFIREQEGFRIWHMVIAMDLNCEAGTDYSQTPVYVDLKKDPQYIEFGQPTIAKILHDPVFNWWDDYPAVPKPYETFSDSISYGPEGFRKPENKGLEAGEGGGYLWKMI